MNVNEKMVMVVDNKKYCLIGRLEWTVKKEKVRKISYVSLKRVLLFFYVFFLCTIQRREIKIDSLMASPLVLNFGTTRMVSWSFIIGWAPPPSGRGLRDLTLTAATGNDPPFPLPPLITYTQHILHRHILYIGTVVDGIMVWNGGQ